jgi:hypothetical protein
MSNGKVPKYGSRAERNGHGRIAPGAPAVFREANERIREVNETFATITDTFDLVCECSSGTCTERISMTPSEYERLRADAAQFAIAQGHEVPGAEEVVARHERYTVVRTGRPDAQRVAYVTDSR